MGLGMRGGDRSCRDDVGAGASPRVAMGLAIGLAMGLGCSIGSGTSETFGSAASVGGNTAAASDSGDSSNSGSGGSGQADAEGTDTGNQEASAEDPPMDTDEPPDPGSEVCNGLDDDADGMVDEDQPMVMCGVGSCAVTEPSCMGGAPHECTPALPGGEVCNGLDDDCNGVADDVQQPCSTACGDGTLGCNGTEQICNAPAAQPEACNLADDDCNGTIDDVGGCRTGIHRSVQPMTGEHFYTASFEEAQCCGFILESANFFWLYAGPHAGLTAFYRCYDPSPGGFHFYTQDPACEGVPVNEGIMGYIATGEGTAGAVPLYRLYLATNGDHFFTTSAAERDSAVASGYAYEGIAGFVW